VNLAPRGELCPQVGEHTILLRRTKGRKEGLHPWWIASPLYLWGQNSPLGANFSPGGQSLSLEAKLKTGQSRALRDSKLVYDATCCCPLDKSTYVNVFGSLKNIHRTYFHCVRNNAQLPILPLVSVKMWAYCTVYLPTYKC
jgi:hypothetical protein